jgi:hypothetical protein
VDQPHACSQPNLTSSAAPSNKSAPLQHVVSRIEISGFCLAINDYRGGEYRSFTSDVELDHCTIYVCYSNARICRPFRAGSFFWMFPGLKPWAKIYSPFGAKTSQTYLSAIPHSTLATSLKTPQPRQPAPEHNSNIILNSCNFSANPPNVLFLLKPSPALARWVLLPPNEPATY